MRGNSHFLFLWLQFVLVYFGRSEKWKSYASPGSWKMPVNSAGFYLSCAKTVHLARLSRLYWHSGDGSGHGTYQSPNPMRRKKLLSPRSPSFKGQIFISVSKENQEKRAKRSFASKAKKNLEGKLRPALLCSFSFFDSLRFGSLQVKMALKARSEASRQIT